jgi:hypothetical protein
MSFCLIVCRLTPGSGAKTRNEHGSGTQIDMMYFAS